ncbi:hypothetical protein XH83_20095 [Bradyrhizobium sp. CCBAU 53351]|uniref:hypothetical protein n=1 Tax=Bradyrhizobium sp. CCBAU 53351 TaxID=1325114 RepID=UPI0018875ECE|nr:hypothetical protein [Bradyrhizobium sp. CCBAU 53351]QOZ77549.1 hypothetical protein XH83_20095 [Bradyrhizobium sp. CCBAU 53351]
MYDVCQWATATLAVVFTAALLITGQWFIQYRLQHETITPVVKIATLTPPAASRPLWSNVLPRNLSD